MSHYPFSKEEDKDMYSPLSSNEERSIIIIVGLLLITILFLIIFAISVNNKQNRWLKEDKVLKEHS